MPMFSCCCEACGAPNLRLSAVAQKGVPKNRGPILGVPVVGGPILGVPIVPLISIIAYLG